MYRNERLGDIIMEFVGIICENGATHCLLNNYRLTQNNTSFILEKKDKKDISHNIGLKSASCIVGENGSGKTRLINEIFKNILTHDEKSDYTFIIVNDDGNFFLTGKKRSVFYKEEQILEYSDKDILCNIIKFSSTLESSQQEGNINNYDISTTNLLYKYGIKRLTEIDMLNQINFVVNYYDDLIQFNKKEQTEFVQIENKNCFMTLSNEGRGILGVKDRYISEQINFSLMKQYLEIGNSSKCNDLITVLYLKFISILLNKIITIIPGNQYNEDGSYNEKFEVEVMSELSNLKSKGEFLDFTGRTVRLKEDYYEDLRSFISNELSELLNKYDKKNNFCDKALKCLDKIEMFHMIFTKPKDLKFSLDKKKAFRKFEKKEMKNQDINDLELLTLIVNEYINGSDMEQDVFSVLNFEWTGVSSGEFALLNLFGRINSIKNKLSKKNIIFLIDEVDIGLHQEWQRLWMYVAPYFFKKLLGNNIQLIITTHSPIVLSDFRKIDVFLIGEHTLEKETFGQNIYTLMMEGLFLKNTIGEHSNLEINKIITELNVLSENGPLEDNQLENLEVKIKYIGDELVKDILLKKLFYIKNDLGVVNYSQMSKQELINRIQLLEEKK